MHINDLLWMTKAYNFALKAKSRNDVPIGAVLVEPTTNKLLGAGWNQVIRNQDPCAHAEIIAIRKAALRLGNYRLPNTTIYVTLEPCIMCAGAIVQARIQRVVFAVRDFKSGGAGSVYNLLRGYPLNHQVQIDEGILQQECRSLLQDFFKQFR